MSCKSKLSALLVGIDGVVSSIVPAAYSPLVKASPVPGGL